LTGFREELNGHENMHIFAGCLGAAWFHDSSKRKGPTYEKLAILN
jgi:hypothetical protein